MDFGFFTIDPNAILENLLAILQQGPIFLFAVVFAFFWPAGVSYFVGKMLHEYLELKAEHYTKNWKPVVLAIDIPSLNVQTPKAVEQMFAQLAGAFTDAGFGDKFTDGFVQRWFSVEVISIAGYIQFVVWTESVYQDLMEAALFAQYPDAEVTEIEDYTKLVPEKLPNETHDIWISDFGLAEHSAYAIRSYTEFEHSISKDTVLKDPMGTFLESFSRLGPNEHMWFQIMVEPTSNSWKEEAIRKVKEILGIEEKVEVKDHIGDKFVKFLMNSLVWFGDQVFSREPNAPEEAGDDKADGPKLTPGVHKVIEKMEEKMNKIAFNVKMRGAYIAPKTVFNTTRGVSLLMGAINQYNIPSANSIVTISAPKGKKKETPSELFEAYKKRSMGTKSPKCIMNVEELATIWHFPMSHVKTPLVSKAASKSAEPPLGLPVEFLGRAAGDTPVNLGGATGGSAAGKKYKTDSGEEIAYDDWYQNL